MSAKIYPTKHGTFEVKWRENGHQKSKSKKTEGEARSFKDEVDRKLAEGRPVMRRKDVPTLREFAIQFLSTKTDLEASTMDQYTRWLGTHVFPELGHLPLVDLRPRRLQEWQDARLKAGAGPAVIGKTQNLLAQILEVAWVPYEYLEANPARALRQPDYKKKPHRWLTAAEVEALRSWYLERDDHGSAALISVLAYVGIRPQDALARIAADLGKDLSVTTKVTGGQIVPGSKTGDGYKRRVKVPTPVRAELEEWIKGDGLIFPRASDGQPWTKNDWDNWRSRHPKKGKRPKCFKRAAEDVGLGGNLKPYDLRHTAGSLMAACGWTSAEIAAQLGHSVTESERTYRHLIDLDGPRRDLDAYILEARGHSDVRAAFGEKAK